MGNFMQTMERELGLQTEDKTNPKTNTRTVKNGNNGNNGNTTNQTIIQNNPGNNNLKKRNMTGGRKRKIRKGPRGGRYYIKKGKKVYV